MPPLPPRPPWAPSPPVVPLAEPSAPVPPWPPLPPIPAVSPLRLLLPPRPPLESTRRWWTGIGATTCPTATKLLICADGGGSTGYRTAGWKSELAALAGETGLTIDVCPLRPGTSKWNKIEHRLFSRTSMNWRGRPLTSHGVIVGSIAATTTSSGLTVQAELDTASYQKGVNIPDRQMTAPEETGTLVPTPVPR